MFLSICICAVQYRFDVGIFLSVDMYKTLRYRYYIYIFYNSLLFNILMETC